MLRVSVYIALIAFCSHRALSATDTKIMNNDDEDSKRPNVIIMHVNNLRWGDLGIHINKADNENSTPNIDRLAYAGIILNRFYSNGGKESLNSGCYQRSTYGKPNLLTTYFERNDYNVNNIAVNDFDHVESFERQVLAVISSDNQPFFMTIDFGQVGVDIKMPFIDDIVGAIVTKAHETGVIDNTIILFLSLPPSSDAELSPIESNIRRVAFIYSPTLSLQQRVSNQLFHVSDLLPTLVNATRLEWPTKDRIFIDGINQWPALSSTNIDARTSLYGFNFYISNSWKLSYGTTTSDIYDIGSNHRDMESDKSEYDFKMYIKSIMSSEIHVILDAKMPAREIMLMRNRAKVHCNAPDVESEATFSIKCSRVSPCLFDLQNDPCEFDDKEESAYDTKRAELKEKLEHYLNNNGIVKELTAQHDDHSDHTNDHPMGDGIDPILTPSGGFDAFITLGLTISTFICTFVIIVCFKERCNTQRSVYGDKSKIVFTDESGRRREDYVNNSEGRISTVSSQIEIRTHL